MRGMFVVGAMAAQLTLTTVAQADTARLREAIEAIVGEIEGEMGVAIEHLETGEKVEVNGNESFPMASTFKIAVLVELFNQFDEGKIRLDQMVDMGGDDLHLGSGVLHDFVAPGLTLSVENLALLMMRISDNSAADKLMEIVGVENVNRRLESIGVRGVSVDRTCQRLILDWLGMPPERTAGKSYREIEEFLNAYQPMPGELDAAAAAFAEDPRDNATPVGMNELLESIFEGRAASEAAGHRMLDILMRCETGENRIRGLLPAGARVAHKTGTLGGTANDVGILYLPGGRGHIVLSVLSKGTTDRKAAERAIAHIARYAYDYFLFTAPAPTGN